MRILYSVQPATGHLQPVVPVCHELRRRGHEVLVVCPSSFCPVVEAFGLTAAPAGLDWLRAEPERSFAALAPLAPHEKYAWILTHLYAGDAARRLLPELREICTGWRPDVIIRDQMEFASWLVGEALAIPHVSYGYGLGFQDPDRALAGPGLARLRHEASLAPDDGLATLFRHLRLEFAPPSYLIPGATRIPRTHHIRYRPSDEQSGGALPEWLDQLGSRKLIVATLGNNYNRTPGVFEAIIAALAPLPFDLVVLVGRNRRREEFGSVPPNVRIEPYVPLSLLAPRADAVICHAGFNTIMTAILAGTPMVLIPIDSDQPAAAQRCRDLGLGPLLERRRLDPERIREAVLAVLHQPAFRTAAAALRREVEALQSTEDAATLIECLGSKAAPYGV